MQAKIIAGGLLFLAVLVLFITPVFCAEFHVRQPPASLDSFYRELGDESKWMRQMRLIAAAFEAVSAQAEAGDWDGAEKDANEFLQHYRQAAEWVPEWKDYFDFVVVEGFRNAVKSKNRERIGEALKKVAATCGRCHRDNSLAVWVRYTWPETRQIKITDPVDEVELDYNSYMHKLAGSLQGITRNFERGKYDRAWKHVFKFKKRIVELRSVCSKCHITEWTKNGSSVKQFFVGPPVLDSVDRLSKLFATAEPDAKKFRKEIDGINRHSCRTCHLIHQPAAHIQKTWRQK